MYMVNDKRIKEYENDNLFIREKTNKSKRITILIIKQEKIDKKKVWKIIKNRENKRKC